jgi:hypothetical protein
MHANGLNSLLIMNGGLHNSCNFAFALDIHLLQYRQRSILYTTLYVYHLKIRQETLQQHLDDPRRVLGMAEPFQEVDGVQLSYHTVQVITGTQYNGPWVTTVQ